jgi:hypothetical protein
MIEPFSLVLSVLASGSRPRSCLIMGVRHPEMEDLDHLCSKWRAASPACNNGRQYCMHSIVCYGRLFPAWNVLVVVFSFCKAQFMR